jgi:hypothetical protein
MGNRDWLVALTGLAFVVLAIISFAIAGEPPDPTDDSVEEVIDFYVDNEDSVFIGSVLAGFAGAALVFFGGYLRMVLRAAEGEGHMLSSVVLAGATILAIGIAFDATINIALADAGDDVEPAAVQALSVLWNNDFIPLAMGNFVFILAAGVSIVRHGALPKWLGWAAVVIGILSITPVGFFAFLLGGLWVAATSIMLAMQARSAGTPGSPPPAPGQPGPA